VGFVLGVDLGTTFTAAAVGRGGRAQIFELSGDLAAIPSVVFACDDGTYLVGEAARRRGLDDPDRVAREFKRRFGGANLLLGGSPYSAHALTSHLLATTFDTVTAREGERADKVVLTYPANWGEFKVDLLRQAAHMCRLEPATITEPEAAAIAYAENERVEVGDTVLVYDLGGGTFDAAVLRKTSSGFEILGHPEGIEQLGGMDFDEAVYNYVLRALPDNAVSKLDFDDPTATVAFADLRARCIAAKEALSFDTQASIPVLLPTVQTQIRLTREEFEVLIRPPLTETMDALNRAIDSAGLKAQDIDRVLLVGGSSRIPLVAQMIAETIGRPVAVDAHPKHAVATGAALNGLPRSARAIPAPHEPPQWPVPPIPPPEPKTTTGPESTGADAMSVDTMEAETARNDGARRSSSQRASRSVRQVSGVVAVAVGAILIVLGEFVFGWATPESGDSITPGSIDGVPFVSQAFVSVGRYLTLAVVVLAVVAFFVPRVRWPTVGAAAVLAAWQSWVVYELSDDLSDLSISIEVGAWAGIVGLVLCAVGSALAPAAPREAASF
jgi:molecular chaperone DnaK (HSP70)